MTRLLVALLLFLCSVSAPVWAQGALNLAGLPELDETDEDGTKPEDKKPVGEIYGFVQTDGIYDGGTINPDWFDAMRPSKLPAFKNEFGEDGNTYFSVRQTRFGVKSWFPTRAGQVKGIFEFDMFGVGANAGQTAIRLRHAYVEYGKFGAGQFHSPFMDIDVFPNSQDYWGPSGMAFFRNVQVRYMPIMSEHNHVSIALERPGASGDAGKHDEIIEARGVKVHFPLPDLSAEYRHTGDWGYVEIAGIVRQIEWDDFTADEFDLSGEATGWGFNLSTNIKIGPNGSTIRASVLYGEGVENYMNDSTSDIAVVEDFDNPRSPLKGELIPVIGVSAFYDINWDEKWTSTVGYSLLDLDYKGSAAADTTFVKGQYALANIQYHPFSKLMGGVELQWLKRDNFSEDYSYDSLRIQVSFRYRYSFWLGEDR